MQNVQSRLSACFHAVFPEVEEPALLLVSQATHSEWDSLASVTLVRLIEEEFGIELDLFDLEQLTSFQVIQEYIEKALVNRA
jgi:acyl carrier protein